jgi:hypothetical protein
MWMGITVSINKHGGILMPWEAIIAGGFPTLLLVLFGFLLYTAIGKAGDAISKRIEQDRAAHLDSIQKVHESNLQLAQEAQKTFLAFTQSVDTDLRQRRFDAYQKLWQMTEIFPLYPIRSQVRYGDLLPFAEELRDWYFKVGGILMSKDTRDTYFKAQNELKGHIAKNRSDIIEDEVYEHIRMACSRLRTELTDDLLSRRDAPTAELSSASASAARTKSTA